MKRPYFCSNLWMIQLFSSSSSSFFFFFFDGIEESFMQVICTLQKFSKISGLKMNLDQTQVVWTGSKTKSHSLDKFLREMNICWDPGISCAWG